MKDYIYDYELFLKGDHYIRLKTQKEWDTVMDELSKLGVKWNGGQPLSYDPYLWEEYFEDTVIAYHGKGLRYGTIGYYNSKGLEELLPLEKGENKRTKQGLNMKDLYNEIDKIYYNEKKRTTVIKFKNGDTSKSTASKGTEFCEYVGFTSALIKYQYGKLEGINTLIKRKRGN